MSQQKAIGKCDECNQPIVETEWGVEVGHQPTCSENPNNK